jgi:hypothetical protein
VSLWGRGPTKESHLLIRKMKMASNPPLYKLPKLSFLSINLFFFIITSYSIPIYQPYKKNSIPANLCKYYSCCLITSTVVPTTNLVVITVIWNSASISFITHLQFTHGQYFYISTVYRRLVHDLSVFVCVL